MLAGHSALFSPPELNLLPFATMRERDLRLGAAAHCSIDCDQRVGLIEAVMNLLNLSADESRRRIAEFVVQNAPIEAVYAWIRELATPRSLVDKSTLNASHVRILTRALCIDPSARYLHLVRHPAAVIDSLQRMYFVGRRDFTAAEELWTVPNRNILSFLQCVDPQQQLRLGFEDLVRDPTKTMRAVSEFLRLDFEDALLTPYRGERMTLGSPGRFQSLGDPMFNTHSTIESEKAEAGKGTHLSAQLSPETRRLSDYLGYTVQGDTSGVERSPLEPRRAAASKVVLVVPPMTYRANAYVTAARKLSLDPICAFDPRFGMIEHIESYLPVSFDYPICAAKLIADYARSWDVSAILPIDDGALEVAALANSLLGWSSNPLTAVRAAIDKHAMRELLQRAGVPSPCFSLHAMCENPYRLAHSLTYPVVVKPLYLSGSRGVIRANNAEEFLAAFDRLCGLLMQPGTGPNPKTFLIEDYIPGVEVSLEGVLVDGVLTPLALYDKPDPLEGPYFEETILVTPSRLSGELQEAIRQCASDAVAAVGLRTGPVQVELRVNERGPWVVELAARTTGGFCSRALPFQNGRTLEELVLSHATGAPVDSFVPADGAHAVMMIPIPGRGVFRGVSGLQAAESVQGITGVMITTKPGELITPLPEGDKYLGFIFATADTPDRADAAVRQAHALLAFDLG